MAETVRSPLEANSGMRPSLARWELRVLDEDVAAHGGDAVGAAEDSDAQLLAVIEHQAIVASTFLRAGDGRKALAVLRRAFRIAEGHSSPPQLIARLAMALARLQICVTLSRLGRHAPALSEARLALAQTEEIWRVLQEGIEILTEAEKFGDFTRPEPSLRKMLLQPPPRWLQRVKETSIHCRQAMAMEMEYLLTASGPSGAASLAGTASFTIGSEAEDGDHRASPYGGPVSKELIDQLHADAARLARELLPEGDAVRGRADRAAQEATVRSDALRKTLTCGSPLAKSSLMKRTLTLDPIVTDGVGDEEYERLHVQPLRMLRFGPKVKMKTPKANMDSSQELPSHPSTASTGLPVFAGSGAHWRSPSMASKKSGAPGSPQTSPPTSPAAARSPNSPLSAMVPTVRTAAGHPSAPPGDVRVHSMIPRPRSTSMPADASSAQQQRSQSPGVVTPREYNKPDRSVDPFTDWKRTVVDEGQMSYLQLTIRTLEGQDKIKEQLRLETRRFKSIDMNRKTLEELVELRQLYSNSGVAIGKQIMKREEEWRKKAWADSQAAQERKERALDAYAYYGVSPPKLSASLPELRAAFQALKANSPLEKERLWEEERLRRQKAREARLAARAASPAKV